MALPTIVNTAMSFSLDNVPPTTCRESYYVYVTNMFTADTKPSVTPPKMTMLLQSTDASKRIEEIMTDELTAKFIKLLDYLVGNTAVALAPIETLSLDGYNPGSYEKLPTGQGRYGVYEAGRLKLAYTAVPTELSLFDPMLMSVLYGLAKAAHFLLVYGLEGKILECVSEDDIVSAIKNKYRDKAFHNMLQILSELNKIYMANKYYVENNTVMKQRSDVTAILRLRARLRDLPLSSIKTNWTHPYKYGGGTYLFHSWKKEKFPDAWSKYRAPIS